MSVRTIGHSCNDSRAAHSRSSTDVRPSNDILHLCKLKMLAIWCYEDYRMPISGKHPAASACFDAHDTSGIKGLVPLRQLPSVWALVGLRHLISLFSFPTIMSKPQKISGGAPLSPRPSRRLAALMDYWKFLSRAPGTPPHLARQPP